MRLVKSVILPALALSLSQAPLTTPGVAAEAPRALVPTAPPALPSPAPRAPGASTGAIRRPRLTAEQRALLEMSEQNRRAVAALSKDLDRAGDGPATRDLARRIEDAKRHAWAKWLYTRAEFARRRGDLASAREAEVLAGMLEARRAGGGEP